MIKLFKSIKEYLLGSISETKKVIWPNKKQVRDYTILVIGMSIGVAVFFSGLDYIFNIGLEKFIK